ncbi:MAG: 16S rRNA (guanine(527)-N(7))-methyltransferase RsmG [Acidobacteria bacterium]|nr:MAG: 16S rRNA (guanine(527)-N(7))-methyltransferase RsmG [Acidobacteriota bacterium]
MTTGSPAILSLAVIRRALEEFKLPAYDDQALQIQRYIKILLAWNDKVNLTAIRDPLEILYRHFCESMFAGISVPIESGRLADAGTGAGFPGLPLKILRPGLQVFLIESNLKKATFLAEVIRDLGLRDAKVVVRRYEELGEELAPQDFVCARAVGEYAKLLDWARSDRLAAKEVVLWIGANALPEIQSNLDWDWREPIPVPNSLRRLLLVGSKKP